MKGSPLTLVDAHAHLDFPDFDNDRGEVVKRAKEFGVKLIVNPGSTLQSNKRIVRLCLEYDFIYASLGVHPHYSNEVRSIDLLKISELTKQKKVVAIGETGLDYYKNKIPKETQIPIFKRHIQIAKETNLPLIIHDRDAHEDVLQILEEEGASRGVFHCFSGNEEVAKRALSLGFYISFAGQITFPNAGNLRKVVSLIPSERLMVETDSPFLAPQHVRGKRNEPYFVKWTVEELARLLNLTPNDIGRIAEFNMKKLFKIGEIQEGKIVYPIRNSLYVNLTNRCTNECIFCPRMEEPIVRGHNLLLTKEPNADEVISALMQALTPQAQDELWQDAQSPSQRRSPEPSIYSLEQGGLAPSRIETVSQQDGDESAGHQGKENNLPYEEVVFCGYGEPFLRLDVLLKVAKFIKSKGMKVRINTNGQGNVIYHRDVTPELAGLIDTVSVSLNAENDERYTKLCQPSSGKSAYEDVKEFVRCAIKYIPSVYVTIVAHPDVNISACQKVAEELDVPLKVRAYNILG